MISTGVSASSMTGTASEAEAEAAELAGVAVQVVSQDNRAVERSQS
jgi:hypothetical protein